MRKTLLLTFLLSVLAFTASAAGSSVKPQKPFRIYIGYQSVTTYQGHSVTVYVEWNTQYPLASRVSNVTVIDNSGLVTFTASSWEQHPRMDLVSGILVASGWRCDLNAGTDYVILNGNLTM